MTPRKLYRSIATAEMVTWALLILGIVLKRTGVTDMATTVFGSIHGFTFLTYGALTILIWINNRWSIGRGLFGLVSAVIPFCTLPFERNTEKAGLLEGEWRFKDRSEKPSGFFDSILALVVRQPVLAAIVIFVLIVALFSALLIMGPPYKG